MGYWPIGGGGGGGVTDHGALTGLDEDDHGQYLTPGRGDIRYYTEAEMEAFLAQITYRVEFTSRGNSAGDSWTNMPAARSEFLAVVRHRRRADLRLYDEARLMIGCGTNVAPAGTYLSVDGSPDGGANWFSVGADLVFSGGAGVYDSNWFTLTPELIADNVLLRPVGGGGNGSTAPGFTFFEVLFRRVPA